MDTQVQIDRIIACRDNIADAISDAGVTVPSGTMIDGLALLVGKIRLVFESVAANFVSDSTYEDYPYRAVIALSGVTDEYVPYVEFSDSDANSGIFSLDAESFEGGIYIYATEQRSATISKIYLWRS